MSDHKSTSADLENFEEKERNEELFKKIFSEKIFDNLKTRDFEDCSFSSLSRISKKSFSIYDSFNFSLLFPKVESPILNRIENIARSTTLNCIFYEEDKVTIVIYIEPINDYTLFSRDFLLKLMKFLYKITIEESQIYINRNHKNYCKSF